MSKMKSYIIDGNVPPCPRVSWKRVCPGPEKCEDEECELVKGLKETECQPTQT